VALVQADQADRFQNQQFSPIVLLGVYEQTELCVKPKFARTIRRLLAQVLGCGVTMLQMTRLPMATSALGSKDQLS
jgi:hypothetical protein